MKHSLPVSAQSNGGEHMITLLYVGLFAAVWLIYMACAAITTLRNY